MQYGHAFGNEDVSGTGKLEAGGYQPPHQYPQYQGHREHEEIPHLTPPFPYPASSGTLPPAVLTTDHAHITRGDANPRYHKIKDFFKGRRHKHKDEHREHEPLPQIPDLSVALSDTQSLGRYPHMHVGAKPDLAPTMAGEVGTMRSHPHRRSINHTKESSPSSLDSPTTSSSSLDEPATPNRDSAFIEETTSKGSTHVQFIPHASGYDGQHIPQYNHRKHHSDTHYFQPQPEYGYQQHALQQYGYGQYQPSDGATPTGRRTSPDGGITPSQRSYPSHHSHGGASHHTHTDRNAKSRKRSASLSAAPFPTDHRSTDTIAPHTYVPTPQDTAQYAQSSDYHNTHRSRRSQQTTLVDEPIPREFASYNPSTSISSTSTHEGRSGRDGGRRDKMGMTRRRSNSHPPALYASNHQPPQSSSWDPSTLYHQPQPPSVHSSHRPRETNYGATRHEKELDEKTDSDILKSVHGSEFEEKMIAKGVLKVPSSGDDGYDYARSEYSGKSRHRRPSDAAEKGGRHGRVGLREKMGMTRKRSSSHPPSIHNYPQQPATNSSSRAPFFSAFSSTQPPPPEVPQVQPEPAYFVATSPSHGSSSRHAVSPEEDYTKVTTTRSSIASTLKREHMGMTRRRSNSQPMPMQSSSSPTHYSSSQHPVRYSTSDSQALPSAMVDGNGRHRRRASFGMKPRFEIPTSRTMEQGLVNWDDDDEVGKSERRRGRGRDGAPEDRSKYARPPLTPPPHPKPFELREYQYGLRVPDYQPI